MATTKLTGILIKTGSIPTTALGGGVISASVQITAQLPAGTVSSSTQLPAGTVSASAQITSFGFISLSNGTLQIGTGSGDEGGELLLAKPQTNNSLTGSGITIDSYQDRIRIFEQGGNARGAYLNVVSQSNSVGSLIVTSPNLFSMRTITSASYAALTPVSGTLYIIIG